MNDELLTAKELAEKLRRTLRYVYKAKARGLPMIAGRITLASALAWLDKNPKPFGK